MGVVLAAASVAVSPAAGGAPMAARGAGQLAGVGTIASAYLATDLGPTGAVTVPQISRKGAFVIFDQYGSYLSGDPSEEVYDVATGTTTTIDEFVVQGPGGNDVPLAVNDSGSVVGIDNTTHVSGVWSPSQPFEVPLDGPDSQLWTMGSYETGGMTHPTGPAFLYSINDSGAAVGYKSIGCYDQLVETGFPPVDSYFECTSAVHLEGPKFGTLVTVSGTRSVENDNLCSSTSGDLTETQFCPEVEALAIDDSGHILGSGPYIQPLSDGGHVAQGLWEWQQGQSPVLIQPDNDELIAMSDAESFLYYDHTSGNACGSSPCFEDSSGAVPVSGTFDGLTPVANPALDVNSSGVVAGQVVVVQGRPTDYATLWSRSTGLVDLSSLVTNLPPGELTSATGIADNGFVVALGRNQHVYLLAPVPTISGHVSNPDGSNASGITVGAAPTVGGTAYTALTDANGDYVIGAPRGGYLVSVSAGVPVGDVASPPSVHVSTSSGDQTVDFSIEPLPSISTVAPSQVAQGAKGVVTIDGSGFLAPIKVTVSGGGVAVSLVSQSTSAITVRAKVDPLAALGADDVTVSDPYGSATCTGCLSVIAAPTLTAIGPPAAQGSSTSVTVTGSGFAPGAKLIGPTGVTFTHVKVVDSATITATEVVSPSAPTGSGLAVTVKNNAAAGYGSATGAVLTIT